MKVIIFALKRPIGVEIDKDLSKFLDLILTADSSTTNFSP